MSRYVDSPSRVTDHSEEIAVLRATAVGTLRSFPTGAPDEKRRNAAMLMCAAALLEVHDESGVSLDNWIGPLELVVEALLLVGRPAEDFLPNQV